MKKLDIMVYAELLKCELTHYILSGCDNENYDLWLCGEIYNCKMLLMKTAHELNLNYKNFLT